MTGCFTRNLEEAALITLEAMPIPRVITIGDCAKDGGIFKGSYAVKERPEVLENVIRATNLHVPGCPPTPEAILRILLAFSLHGPKSRADVP
jgi:Ni,Fe-hydrogenase III small subunit